MPVPHIIAGVAVLTIGVLIGGFLYLMDERNQSSYHKPYTSRRAPSPPKDTTRRNATVASHGIRKRGEGQQPHDAECLVCTDPLTRHQQIVTLQCKHSFHSSCIDDWYRYSHVCPSCRVPFNLK